MSGHRWAARIVLGAILGLAYLPAVGRGQAVAFAPVIGQAPDGVALNVTPVVTADRRYVRMGGLNAAFVGFQGFDTFNVPAAVGGGGFASVAPGGYYPYSGYVVPPYGYGGYYYPGYWSPVSGAPYGAFGVPPLPYKSPYNRPPMTVNGLNYLGGPIGSSIRPGSWGR